MSGRRVPSDSGSFRICFPVNFILLRRKYKFMNFDQSSPYLTLKKSVIRLNASLRTISTVFEALKEWRGMSILSVFMISHTFV